jgi:hypothetical protein
MNSNSHQESIELEEARKLKEQHRITQEQKQAVSLVFAPLIDGVALMIDEWRATAPKPRGEAATPNRKAYRDLIDSLDSRRLAEAIVQAIFEPFIRPEYSQDIPVIYQNIVNGGLISGRLRNLLPNEELALPIQDKFSLIDMLVTKVIFGWPDLFTNVAPTRPKETASIVLTDRAWSLLNKVDAEYINTSVPMLCKPAEWTSIFDGGYLTDERRRGNALVASIHHNYAELRAIDRSLQANPEILQSVNKMQGVSFCVDENFMKYQKVIDKIRRKKVRELEDRLSALKSEYKQLISKTNEI